MQIIKKVILDVELDAFRNDGTDEVVSRIQNAAKTATKVESRNRNSFPLRPSSCLKGARDLYYALENWEKPGTIPSTDIEGRSCMLLNLGHAIEKHLVDHIKLTYKVPRTNIRVQYGEIKAADGTIRTLDGELDFVIELDCGEKVICDSKSSAAFPFRSGDLPKEDHIAQINLYLHSQWAIDQRIKKAFIFYYNKDTSDIKVYEFYYDKALAEAVLDRFQKIYTNWEFKKLPARQHYLGVDWQAKYSSFRDYEWAEYELDVNKRTVVNDDPLLEINDKKQLLKALIKKHGTNIVKSSNGKQAYALKKGDDMKLCLEDADGFES